MKNFLIERKKDIKEIFIRLLKRDFSGNSGIAIKNSVYQFSTSIIAKVGSLIFTIILARLLIPELFGVYSLALSTLLLFVGFTDLGLDSILILFLPKLLLQKKNAKAKSYFLYISKLKLLLTLVIISFLLIMSDFLSNNYYQKPIFLALLVGAVYVFFRSFVSFSKSIFYAVNNFKHPFVWETVFQLLRLVLVPLAVILFLDSIVLNQSNIYIVVLALALAWILTSLLILYSFFSSIKFVKTPSQKLTKKESKYLHKILFPLSATTLSGIFFGYVDILVLGKFVISEFIGFYQVAFSLVSSMIALMPFSIVLLPIFSRIKGKRLSTALSKSIKGISLLSLGAGILTFIFAPLMIKIAFGGNYLDSVIFLRILSLIVFIVPLNSVYSSNLLARKKTLLVSKLLILTTLLNVFLNFGVAYLLLSLGNKAVVFGICATTIFTKYFYFLLLFMATRKKDK